MRQAQITRSPPAPAGADAAGDRHLASGFVLALALYFAAQALARSLTGGALEVDESEMILLARGWHLGYGPQLPLYNWLQVASFAVFGVTTFALTGLKNGVLFLAYAALFAGLRRVVPVRQAVAGTLALALLPNVAWEFQRASTHSIVLLACVTATIAAFLMVVQRGRLTDYALLGVAMGLGGLAKYNFWLVPPALILAAASLPELRRPGLRARLQWQGAVLSVAVAGAMLVAPYIWVLRHPAVSMASARKLYDPAEAASLPGWRGFGGLYDVAEGTVAALLVVALVAWAFRPWRGARVGAAPWPGRLLLRAGVLALIVVTLGVALGGVSNVRARWLVPVYCLLAPGMMLLATQAAGARAIRRLLAGMAVLAVVLVGAMTALRLQGRATGAIDFTALAALVDAEAPDLVLADYHIGGNLAFLRPGLAVLAAPARLFDQPMPARVMVLAGSGMARANRPARIPMPAEALAANGIRAPAALTPLAEGALDLPFRGVAGAIFPVRWVIVTAAR